MSILMIILSPYLFLQALTSALQSKNAVCALQINCKLLSFPLRNPAEISWQSILFQTFKQYLLYQTHVNTTFQHGVDWSEIVGLMEVSCMLYKCTYCLFTLYCRLVGWCSHFSISCQDSTGYSIRFEYKISISGWYWEK